ncbi:MDP1 [Symbiodinium sp. CCMP2592]|nr:MDP1 [Symbiodinium sp. CCMP2592]
MENEMLADYLQRDAERASGLEDTDEAKSKMQALSDLPSSPVDKGKKAVFSIVKEQLKVVDKGSSCALSDLLGGPEAVARVFTMYQGYFAPTVLFDARSLCVALEFLWRRGLLEDQDLERMLKPPDGLNRGQVLGLVDLDATRQYTADELRSPAVQNSVTSEAVGKWATPVLSAWWLQTPLRERGQPGVWTVRLPRSAIPAPAMTLFSQPTISDVESLPLLMVFDLDGVCWSPDMYQTKGGEPYSLVAPGLVKNSKDEEIRLFPAVQAVWKMLHSPEARSRGVRVAVASSSRRHKAVPLLKAMEIVPGVSMWDVIDPRLFEMYYRRGEGKRPHLEALLSKSAVSPSDVLFVDDAAENVQSVRSLGVQAVHLPQGLTQEAWSLALESYVKSRAK